MTNENRERKANDNSLSNAGENAREGMSDMGNEARDQANRAGQGASNRAKEFGRDTKDTLT